MMQASSKKLEVGGGRCKKVMGWVLPCMGCAVVLYVICRRRNTIEANRVDNNGAGDENENENERTAKAKDVSY